MEKEITTHSDSSSAGSSRQSWIHRHPIASVFIVLFALSVIALILFFTLRPYFSTFDRAGQGELSSSMSSPNGEYTAELYGVPYGGAAGGVTLWVDVKKTGDTSPSGAKSIYRAAFNGSNHLEWESEHTLRIENWNEYSNETITLDINEEIYDGRGWACKSLLTKDQYVRCLTPEGEGGTAGKDD